MPAWTGPPPRPVQRRHRGRGGRGLARASARARRVRSSPPAASARPRCCAPVPARSGRPPGACPRRLPLLGPARRRRRIRWRDSAAGGDDSDDDGAPAFRRAAHPRAGPWRPFRARLCGCLGRPVIGAGASGARNARRRGPARTPTRVVCQGTPDAHAPAVQAGPADAPALARRAGPPRRDGCRRDFGRAALRALLRGPARRGGAARAQGLRRLVLAVPPAGAVPARPSLHLAWGGGLSVPGRAGLRGATLRHPVPAQRPSPGCPGARDPTEAGGPGRRCRPRHHLTPRP